MLIPDWKKAHRFNTVRIAAFWGLVCGALLILPALQDLIPLWLFAVLGLLMSVAVSVARIMHQPGLD